MYRIYIVEDEDTIAKSVSSQVATWGWEAYICKDFRNVVEEFKKIEPHLVLMDISLPAFDGYYWCNQIRNISKVPIVFMSSASDNMNIVMAMNMGADDFIAKPFDSNVLIAKISAMLRRTYDFANEFTCLEYNGARLNTNNHNLIVGDNTIELTKNEYRILLTLLENKQKVVSREKIMEALWESDEFVDDNTLTVNINRLRKKLEKENLKDYIKTKFGVGYIIE